MMMSRPALPGRTTLLPLAPCVKVALFVFLSSYSRGAPLLKVIVMRSYPGCAPMRTSLTNAVTGPSGVMGPRFVPHWNSGRFDTGDADGDTLGLAVATPVPTFEVGRRSGLATNSTPTMSTAITPAATVAIQKGPRDSGAAAIEARTRSRRPGLGEPVIWSSVLFSSRRKSSLLTSEHLLDREVGPQPLRSAVDGCLGGGLRHPQG